MLVVDLNSTANNKNLFQICTSVMLNFLILSEESFLMILLRFRLGSGVLK